jgi:hypothetical protein
VLIEGNEFSRLSLSSSLIHFEGLEDAQPFVLKANKFSYVHTYSGTGILRFSRLFDKLHALNQSVEIFTQLTLGGSIQIEGNQFAEVVGCGPYTHTTIFDIGVVFKDLNNLDPVEMKEAGRRGVVRNGPEHKPWDMEIALVMDEMWHNGTITYFNSFTDTNGNVLIDNIHPLSLILKNNRYTNISMGTSENINGEIIVKGSLLKFLNIANIDM